MADFGRSGRWQCTVATRVLSIFVVSCAASRWGVIADTVTLDLNSCGRTYEGIGGLSNSCAPWLKAYPAAQLSDILDVLFKPHFAGSAQVLKLEVGGDAHSTINTESSHMHNSDPKQQSFERGWELWMAAEAVKRNPDIKVGGLAWGWPGWTAGSVSLKTDYLVNWVQGVNETWNISISFIGLQNEAAITGGAPAFATMLRQKLDTSGFTATIIDCCDSHDFGFLSDLTNKSSDYFKAVAALAVHEPLRNAESVPEAALNTGKPIWSSEAYTTYSDSNGGGCWARALNWGYVKGNVTRHIAWNLIQAYPSVGSGMNYDGHGLMWAEVPWSGHYVVNSPIWAMAHYTQATAPGWKYLQVGSGSGMLSGGGSYVSLVSPSACASSSTTAASPSSSLSSSSSSLSSSPSSSSASSTSKKEIVDVTIVIQTMDWNNSLCFKDTHPHFDVVPQNVTFNIPTILFNTLRKNTAGNGVTFYRRRSVFVPGDPIPPTAFVPPSQQRNVYFEPMDAINMTTAGSFVVEVGVNEILTISTMPGAGWKGGATADGKDAGLPVIPNSTAWPLNLCASLVGHRNNAALVDAIVAIDQQGVWEAMPSRDVKLNKTTTMQQVIQQEPEEWHNWGKLKHPATFIGPAVNLTSPLGATIECKILPPTQVGTWAGIGIGPQGTVQPNVPGGAGSNTLVVTSDNKWYFGGLTGDIKHVGEDGWFNLSLVVTTNAEKCTAMINGIAVGDVHTDDGVDVVGVGVGDGCALGSIGLTDSFTFLTASYSGTGKHAEFRDVCVNFEATSTVAPPPPPPVPPSPPSPPSPPPVGEPGTLALATCNTVSAHELFTFSGEDGGEEGTLIPNSNTSWCLDASVVHTPPIKLQRCQQGLQAQQWTWSSKTKR